MKKAGLVLALVCVLSGCGGESGELERAMDLRAKLLQCSACQFEAQVTADYGDGTTEFSLSCQADGAGDLSFTVAAPESIRDIAGTVRDGRVTFDGTALEFLPMADGHIAPILTPWIFLRTLRGGNLTSAGMEGELLRLSIDDSFDDDALHLDIWLDQQDVPVRAEILYDGRRYLSLNVAGWSIV